MKRSALLLLMYSLFLVLSCEKETIGVQPIQEVEINPYLKPLTNCANYQTYRIDSKSRTVQKFTVFNHYFVYGGHDHLQVKSSINGSSIVEIENVQLGINKFQKYGNKLIICGNKGIYELDQNANLRTVVNVPCRDIDIYHSDLIFTSGLGILGSQNRRAANILVLQLEQDTFDYFTNPADENLVSFMDDIEIIGDDIYVLGFLSENEIYRFSGSNFLEKYTNANNPALAAVKYPGSAANSYLFSHNDRLVYATTNSSKYILIDEGDGAFKPLLFLEGYDLSRSELDNLFQLHRHTDHQVIGDTLYWSTYGGMFEFNLAADTLTYSLVIDTLLPHKAISTFQFDDLKKEHYVVTNHRDITKISCN